MTTQPLQPSLRVTMDQLGRAVREAARALANSRDKVRSEALRHAANAITRRAPEILSANEADLSAAREQGGSDAMLDRLALDDKRIRSMAESLCLVADLPDPLGKLLAEWRRPNGLLIQRISVPLGVIGIIYESRPNVTADAGALCIKSGNAAILRGGSESFSSSRAIHACIKEGLRAAGLPASSVQMVPTTDRAAVGYLLSSMAGYVDVIVPRGGKSLVSRVQQEARVPVIGHLEGVCHVYLHEAADPEMAKAIAVNAKMRRTGICGAAETLLIDKAAAERLVAPVCSALADAGCEIRGDASVQALFPDAQSATDEDWATEYLDAIISVRLVNDIDTAIDHIRRFGSGHTECIVTGDSAAAEKFFGELDSAILLHNASTQFADGGEFGMGAEIGIATGRIHARGPVGAEQLTSYKYVVRGTGQTRA